MSRGMGATAHSRELMYFLMLSPVEQANAIRRLAAAGQSEQAIATATKLAPEQIRRILAEPKEPG